MTDSKYMKEIALLIVLYNPKNEDVKNVKIIAEKYRGVIIDNSGYKNFETDNVGHMKYLYLGINTGIANAQNEGLKYLVKQTEIKYFVFLDQDSRVDIEYPIKIVSEYKRIKNKIPQLALLGPTVIEAGTKKEYLSIIHKKHAEKYGFEKRRDVISSGSVIDKITLKNVGTMLSTLFIDFVDFEWCWRAESKGFLCGITKNVCITHKVGRSNKNICGYKILIWQPFRYFYQFRNHLWLCQIPYVPMQWKIATCIKHLLRFMYFPFVITEGHECWKEMCRGLFTQKKSYKEFRKEIASYYPQYNP